MCGCWKDDAIERPNFSDLVSTIAAHLECVAGYLNFSPTLLADKQQWKSVYNDQTKPDTQNVTVACDKLLPSAIITDDDTSVTVVTDIQ